MLQHVITQHVIQMKRLHCAIVMLVPSPLPNSINYHLYLVLSENTGHPFSVMFVSVPGEK